MLRPHPICDVTCSCQGHHERDELIESVRIGRRVMQTAGRTSPTREAGLGVHVADLGGADLRTGQRIDFSLRWSDTGEWQGTDYGVDLR
jgi:hypothetical protein